MVSEGQWAEGRRQAQVQETRLRSSMANEKWEMVDSSLKCNMGGCESSDIRTESGSDRPKIQQRVLILLCFAVQAAFLTNS
jgi:hypothetical protein